MCQIIITDSFRVSMLPTNSVRGVMEVLVEFRPVSAETVRYWCSPRYVEVVSAIDNIDTARTVSGILGIELPVSHIHVKMTGLECIIIAQCSGSLPPGGIVKEFWKVRVSSWH